MYSITAKDLRLFITLASRASATEFNEAYCDAHCTYPETPHEQEATVRELEGKFLGNEEG